MPPFWFLLRFSDLSRVYDPDIYAGHPGPISLPIPPRVSAVVSIIAGEETASCAWQWALQPELIA